MFDATVANSDTHLGNSGFSALHSYGFEGGQNMTRGLLDSKPFSNDTALHTNDSLNSHKLNSTLAFDLDALNQDIIPSSRSSAFSTNDAIDPVSGSRSLTTTSVSSDPITGMGASQALVGRASSSTDDGFSIQVNFGEGLERLSDSALYAIEQAAEVWEEVIAGSTFYGDHHLVIDVNGFNEAAAELANAGWSQLAQDAYGTWMPVRGEFSINMAYSNDYNSNLDYLFNVMVHEFGHVLGIGTLWEGNGRNLVDESTGTYYANTSAGWVYGQWLDDAPTAIPLTVGEGEGSDFSHWSEEVFDQELMTHEAEDPGVSLPLSELTIASLEDLGWIVDWSAAGTYVLS
ncbi:MAG: hypothetical protein Kow00121_59870 [Elainellaceae cyanobacterium]